MFIELDIFMSEEDAQNTSPSIWIEQRIYESGKETTVARQSFFQEQLVAGRVYVFKECGDQILGQDKLPDLHFTARELPDAEWAEYQKTAKYYGYDRDVEIRPSRTDLQYGKELAYDFSQDPGISCSGIEVVCSRRLPGQSSLDQDSYVSTIKLRGMGAWSEDKVTRGDLKLRICLA